MRVWGGGGVLQGRVVLGGGGGGGDVGQQQGEASYPSQGLFHGDHLLLHHHHELDALLVAHGDLAGDVADVLSCKEEEAKCEGSSLKWRTDGWMGLEDWRATNLWTSDA